MFPRAPRSASDIAAARLVGEGVAMGAAMGAAVGGAGLLAGEEVNAACGAPVDVGEGCPRERWAGGLALSGLLDSSGLLLLAAEDVLQRHAELLYAHL